MTVSTRGRYALRVLTDLAEHNGDNYIPLKDIVARQEISQKYLESIMADMTKSGFLDGQHGKGGGYKLKRSPDEITVFEVLQTTEGDMAPIACLSAAAKPCARAAECRTLPMWEKFYEITRDYFSGITIADLAQTDLNGGNYVI
ncbi:MAG: Rrf2 family transcriptional regulator [Candidatus Borkfalkiaceae bacterium]|nr:Rrf2 family transcriptional regulator [Christensenellaceae bacterium]